MVYKERSIDQDFRETKVQRSDRTNFSSKSRETIRQRFVFFLYSETNFELPVNVFFRRNFVRNSVCVDFLSRVERKLNDNSVNRRVVVQFLNLVQQLEKEKKSFFDFDDSDRIDDRTNNLYLQITIRYLKGKN